MVETIETHFVPLLIKNNAPGADAALLKRFKEPSWNYQVVRFLDADAKDIIPRKDRVWTTPALAARMAEALKKHGREVPEALGKLASS